MKAAINQTGAESAVARTWVLVAGGFHRAGGMDAANAALAGYLTGLGCRVHLVSHHVDYDLQHDTAVTVHQVPRPRNSYFLGGRLLEQVGRAVARETLAADPSARVIVNGGNCVFADINWVHSVHHAWASRHDGAPLWFKAKSAIDKVISRRRERAALRSARVIIANSNRTRRDLIDSLNIEASRVHTVYLGAEPHWRVATAERRSSARQWLGVETGTPVIAFVGALGYDTNKGFKTVWRAWTQLSRAADRWDAVLIVTGGGRALEGWRARLNEAGLQRRVRIIGHTDRVVDVLAAADLLVSPSYYEAYGLAVHEAICCGVPAMVTASAGVAERYPSSLRELLIQDPDDAAALAAMILKWRASIPAWKEKIQPLARELRSRTWDAMAAEIVAIASAAPAASLNESIQ
jgi:glycosyltransferase involved in cell wall biosynthesis